MSEYKAVTPDGRGGVQAALARETLSSMAIGTKTDALGHPADTRENRERESAPPRALRSEVGALIDARCALSL